MKRPHLGELNELYEVYLDAIDGIPAEETVDLPWYPEIAKDERAKALKKIQPGMSAQDIEEILAESATYPISARRASLLGAGISGTVVELFDRLKEIQDDPERPIDHATLSLVGLYRSIPQSHVKGARLVTDQRGSYYVYGGKSHHLIVEPDFVD